MVGRARVLGLGASGKQGWGRGSVAESLPSTVRPGFRPQHRKTNKVGSRGQAGREEGPQTRELFWVKEQTCTGASRGPCMRTPEEEQTWVWGGGAGLGDGDTSGEAEAQPGQEEQRG